MRLKLFNYHLVRLSAVQVTPYCKENGAQHKKKPVKTKFLCMGHSASTNMVCNQLYEDVTRANSSQLAGQ